MNNSNYGIVKLPEQRTSIKKKTEEKWYVPTINYWINRAISLNNKQSTEYNLNAANGIVDEEAYKYVLSPLTKSDGAEDIELPGTFRDIDIITPIKEKNIGEYILLPYKFFVTVENADSILLKSKYIEEELYSYIEQLVINEINKEEESGVPSKELENIEEFKEKVTDSWFDERAIEGQHILKNINKVNNFNIERLQNFFYWWATEEFYVYREIINNEVYKTTISPLEGYPIENGEQFVEDNEGFLIKNNISFLEFKHKYWDNLSHEDRKYFEYLESQVTDGMLNLNVGEIYQEYGRRVFRNDGHQYEDTDTIQLSNSLICEYIVFFVTEVEKNILTYKNKLGNVLSREVAEDYELNTELGDIELNKKWEQEVWKGVRLGDSNTSGANIGVYLTPEPEDVQRYTIDGRAKLPITGKRGLLNGNIINPVPKRLITYQAMIRFLNLQQERTIAKHKGNIMLIPKSMLESNDSVDAKKQTYYMLADNKLIYDDTEVDLQTAVQGFRVVGNPGLEAYIGMLEELKRNAKSDAWDLASMNDARSGQANPYSTVRNNEQNLFRAKLGSELMISVFNLALEREHIADLEYSKLAYIDGKVGSYTGEDKKEVKFQVNSNRHLYAEYGISVANSKVEEEKLARYQELAFAASQGGDFEIADKAISSDSSVELSNFIQKFSEAKRQFEQSQKEMDLQIQETEAQKEITLDAANKQHDLDVIRLENELETERLLEIERIKAVSSGNANATKQAIDTAKYNLSVRAQEHKEKIDNKNLNNKTIKK